MKLYIAILSFLLWMCMLPTEQGLCPGFLGIARLLPVLCVITGAYIAVQPKKELFTSQLDILVILLGIYFTFNIFYGENFPCSTQILTNFSILLFYSALRAMTAYREIEPWVLVVFIMLFGGIEACLGLCQIIGDGSRHYLYLLTGSFQNPGPYSAILLMTVVVGLTAAKERWSVLYDSLMLDYRGTTLLRYLIPLVLILALIVLPVTWSRASLISLAIILLWVYRREYWRWRYPVWILGVVLAASFYFIKQGSADGRLLTWTGSILAWLYSPFTGVGTGSFHFACAFGISELYAKVPESWLFANGNVAEFAFCDLLKVLVEQGLIGAGLYIAIMGITLYNLYGWCKPLFYGFLSLLLFSMFSYPFELPAYRIIAVMLAALCPHRTKWSNDTSRNPTLVMLALTALGSYFISDEMQRHYDANREVRSFAGMQHTAFINDYYELLPTQTDNASFLFSFGKTLREAGRYNDSNDILRQGTLVSSDPMFYVIMGNNYSDMGYYDMAEWAYHKAHAMMPNRIYPSYKLMRLYCQLGDTLTARQMAEQIVTRKPKVSSSATDSMVREAKNLIKQDK